VAWFTPERARVLGRLGAIKLNSMLTPSQRSANARKAAHKRWHRRITLEFIKQEVRKLDPRLLESEKEFDIAVVLLSLAPKHLNRKRVCEFTKYPMSFIDEVFDKLIANKVIENGRLSVEWFKKEGGVIAFWLDVCVVMGWIARVHEPQR
jgi:hypothetical protein